MAGIIKAGAAATERNIVRSVRFNLDDVASRADEYLDTVRAQAADIIEQAQREVDVLRKRGYADGCRAAADEARKAAVLELEKRLETLFPALRESIELLGQYKQAWLRNWEQHAVRLAVMIAERIVRREIQRSPDISLAWIREALELADNSGRLKLFLHPKDFETLHDRIAQVVQEFESLATTEILPDKDVSPGGCRVVTEFGVIDQQIEAQLARIEEEMLA